MNKHLDLLGKKVKDKVTGFSGVVSSVSFDLYGCVQATICPGMDKEGKLKDAHWFDVSRLEVLSKSPVMERPDFQTGPASEGLKGPAEKPVPRQ